MRCWRTPPPALSVQSSGWAPAGRLVPIYGNDVWLHLVLGVVAAYFGFLSPAAKRLETT